MTDRILEGNRVLPDGRLETVRVVLSGGSIHAVTPYQSTDSTLPFIMPGFIDVHVHGGGGADTMDATEQAFTTMTRTHAAHGTTTLLLTTVTSTPEAVDAVLPAVQNYMQPSSNDRPGAAVAGVHLEGPFIHPDRKGAHDPACIIPPDLALAERWFSTGVVKMITMAPDLAGADTVIQSAADRGIIVSAGHTQANADHIRRAKQFGLSHVTHLCNAMRPFLHRDVGPIGAVISDDELTGDLISDGFHLDPSMVKALTRTIDPHRLLLITDGIRAVDMPEGQYELGSFTVTVHNGQCTLPDGTLAGSVLTMEQAVHRAHRFSGLSLWTIQQMASENPARKLGLSRKGRIEPGYDADLVLLDDAFRVLETYVGGQQVFDHRRHAGYR